MNTNAYLKRIGLSADAQTPCLANLIQLQRNHVSHICFETIDMALGREVTLDLEKAFDKVINKGRGGFCYELNRLFAWLLKELGYKLQFVQCRQYLQLTNSWMPMYAHIALLVDLGEDGKYLADVGFSYIFRQPLEFVPGKVQLDMYGSFKIESSTESSEFTLMRSNKQEIIVWEPVYQINLADTCESDFLRPLSFVQSKDCTRLYNRTFVIRHLDDLHVFLAGYVLTKIYFKNGVIQKREEQTINSDEEINSLVRDLFNVKLDCSFTPRNIPLP